MNDIKTMPRAEFLNLPSYDKNTVQSGKTYKLFDFNIKCKIAYIKTIFSIDGQKIKSKIFEIKVTD